MLVHLQRSNLSNHRKAKRLLADCEKRSLEVQHDFEFQEAQLQVLKADKDKLVDVAEKVDKRVLACESDVGFRHVYD